VRKRAAPPSAIQPPCSLRYSRAGVALRNASLWQLHPLCQGTAKAVVAGKMANATSDSSFMDRFEESYCRAVNDTEWQSSAAPAKSLSIDWLKTIVLRQRKTALD